MSNNIGEMKRRREVEKDSEIKSAIEELSVMVKMKAGDKLDPPHLPTRPFLYVCSLVIGVLDKIGPSMTVLRQDIDQNIQRLDIVFNSDPSAYSNLVEILKKESNEGNSRKRTSCSKAVVWLTRSLDFAITLLQILAKDPGKNMEEAVEESYNITLKPWQGWISSASFKIALMLVPNNNTFIDILKPKDDHFETLKEDIETLTSLLLPLLEEIHSILKSYRLEGFKSK